MSSLSPSLGETYTLTELPRVPGLDLRERIVVAESHLWRTVADTDSIDLGISKLIISSYILKPSPKLVWSHPLSPSTLVDCLDTHGLLYLAGVTDRKKSKLLMVQRSTDESTATAEASLPEPARAVHFSSPTRAHVLLRSGAFCIAEIDNDSLKISPPPANVPSLGSGSRRVVYHAFLKSLEAANGNNLLFYIVRDQQLHALTYRLLSLDTSRSYEVYQITGPANNALTVYSCIGETLYSFNKDKCTLHASSLMKPHDILESLSLQKLMKNYTPGDSVAVFGVAADRLMVSHKSLVYLINFKFGSVLGEHTNLSGNEALLTFALPIPADSPESKLSFALYLNLEAKSKTCKLKLIQVDAGLNLLSESLGKAIDKPAEPTWSELPCLAESDFHKKQDSEGLSEKYRKLVKAQQKQKVKDFDKQMAKCFKKDPKAMLKYSSATDKVVDHTFLRLILALILCFDDDGKVQLVSDAFFPEASFGYLLLHPLFPVEYTNGLLLLLSALDQPALLKLAIQKCPVITIDELMVELTNLTEVSEELRSEGKDEEPFVSELLRVSVDRIVTDYSLGVITAKLQETLNFDYEADSKKLERMLNVLININTANAWTFVQAVIDVGGLFNWNVPTVMALSEVIDAKLDALTSNSYNLALVNQVMMAAKQPQKKKGKKHVQQVVDNIHVLTDHRTQLESMLTISNATSNRRLLADEELELAKQIPPYSREKLVL